MKVLQVITSLHQGGAEVIATQLVERLRKRGHEVDICVFNGEETPLMKQLKADVPDVKIYKLGNGYYNPFYILKLARIMKEYDIVHTHNSSPQLFVALAKVLCSVELVSTEHTTSNRKRGWKWYRPIESWMYGQYGHVVCISKIAEEKLREYMGGAWLDVNSEKYRLISTINNGVDVNAIHRAAPDEKLLRAKGGRKAILMVAGFREAKDQDTVVRALKHLDVDKFEVWFAGVGVRQEKVRLLAESLGVSNRVRFLGVRTDIPNVLKASDIIVMSSHWEGLSLSNIEGMSAGKPFLASDVNGLREVTKDWGLLFPHEDSKALAEIIKKLADNSDFFQLVADRCYQRAKQFDIDNMVEGYNQVYMDLMQDKEYRCKGIKKS